MDAMRYREGTLGAVWITLGMANLGMLAAVLLPAFSRSTPLLLALLSSMCTGATLFLTGACGQGCRARPASPCAWPACKRLHVRLSSLCHVWLRPAVR